MAKVGDLEIEAKVFETTKEMLIRYGVRGWNMDELSKECGVSKRTLYKIIGNKEDLLYKCNEDNITFEIEKRKKFLTFNTKEEYKEKLNILSSYFSNCFEEFVLLNAKEMIVEYPRIGDLIEDKKRILRSDMEGFFREGQKLGFIEQEFGPDLISGFIENIISFHIQRRQTAKSFGENIKPELDIIIAGIRKC